MALARTARMHWAGTYDQALDYAAGAVVRQGGGLYCARLLRPHGAVAPVDDAASWDTLAPAPAQAGVPVLTGPYVVDYTDLSTEAATKDLWVPAIGDVLLGLFVDAPSTVGWDHGVPTLVLGSRSDTFVRANQSGWGTASDGHVWQSNYHPTGSVVAIASNKATQTGLAADSDQLLLGPPLPTADTDVLLHWSVTSASPAGCGPTIILRSNDQTSAAVQVTSTLEGHYSLNVNDAEAGQSDLPEPTWSGGGSGTWFWTRVQAWGRTLRARTWAGTLGDEPGPGSWDVVWASSIAVGPGRVGLYSNTSGTADVASYDHFTARALVEPLQRPASGEAVVFHSTDPVQIQLAQTGGTDPGSGHVELYALIARAVAP